MKSPVINRHRAHPLLILFNLRQFFVLAIIPILRGLFSALKGELSNWSEGLWMDLFILLLILLFSFLSWWRHTYTLGEAYLQVEKGLFLHGSTRLLWERVTVLKADYPFLLRPFQVGFLRVDTLGGSHRKADITLILSREKIQTIVSTYSPPHPEEEPDFIVPPLRSVVGLALLSTNSFIGVFYMATFVSQSGKIFGREFSDLILASFQAFTATINIRMSPAAAALAYLLIAAWAIGVVFTVLRYLPFKALRKKQLLVLSGGYLSKQHQYINVSKMNFINIRQNILTFFLGHYSVYISAVGCGKERSDITCVLPLGKKAWVDSSLSLLFPKLERASLRLRPTPWGFMSYLFDPLVTCGVVLLAAVLGVYFIPSWTSFIRLVGLMVFIPSVAFLVMRIVEYQLAGIGRTDHTVTIRFSTGFSLHTQLIPLDKIVKIKLVQSFWQRFYGNCDLLLFTQGEIKSKHRCRNLSLKESAAFFALEELDYQPTFLFPNLFSKIK